MLRFVSEPMPAGSVAALYDDGDVTIVLLNSEVTAPAVRCEAVNQLLAGLSRPALTSLSSQVA